ncbi:type 1 glutamine amidotransferase domain-containing protein [Macrococcus carouselicus]|uniref:Type 1 glutamine amidotransferase domain-containing protein n=1 Tax=Macrococcus carouselicus TaxID=69969 RepID=A0A9Q8CKN5_9STAP|nr:type 1 glutamine amidotransferase domain-containing protein [Macrococcus carouselicus]TDL96600.1 type 1 glutamine amidotransferase domain-containing protein [Macrococcus carouselicus]
MKKILVVLTNTEKYETINRATGLWLGEAAQFVEVVNAAGYQIDYVSPHGGLVPLDPASLSTADDIDFKWYGDADFRERALADSKKPADINPDDYEAIYYTGGHGTMWDFKDNIELQQIAEKIYKQGGYITGVCHGVVGLVNLLDSESGKRLIKGKKVTGFSNLEERLNRTKKHVPFLAEDSLKEAGAKYKSKRPMKEYVRTDGQFITGQNPTSAKKVGKELVKALNK